MKQKYFKFSWIAMAVWTGLSVLFGLSSCMQSIQVVADAHSSAGATGATLGLFLANGIIAFIWFVGFVALGILTLILKPSNTEKQAQSLFLKPVQTEEEELAVLAPTSYKHVATKSPLLSFVGWTVAAMTLLYFMYAPFRNDANNFLAVESLQIELWFKQIKNYMNI